MKCPNCSAEVDSAEKRCPYCDSEIVKEKSVPNVVNNYYGTGSEPSEVNVSCPKCGSRKIKFQREESGSSKGKRARDVFYRTVGICQDCGYTWNTNTTEKKKKSVLWWIIVVLFWPVSLSIWFYKTEKIKLKKMYKIIILTVFWLLLIIPTFTSSGDKTTTETEVEINTTSVAESSEYQDKTKTISEKENKDTTKATSTKKTTTTTTTTVKTTTTAPTTKSIPLGKINALAKAESYLSFSAFSYKGLIKQLEYEGFSTEEATYGADHCNADWNEQAAKKAADYLDFMSFSKSGLIEQLEYEGFTYEQAVYGAEAVGY